MSKLLRVVVVDDSEDDALLVIHTLEHEGYNLKWILVDAASALKVALKQTWDIIICDYSMPHFSGLAALKIVKDLAPYLPFILVSGTVGEEQAVNALKAGAHDYIMKDKLALLPPAIERELREATARKQQKKTEEALQKSEERYRSLYESSKDGIGYADLQGNILDANQAFLNMVGYTVEECKKLSFQQLTPKKWHEMDADIIKNHVLVRGYSDEYEKEYIKKDGTVCPAAIRVWLIRDKQGKPTGMWAMIRDITERKRAEEKIMASLREKDVLLQEVHHRVKNNMQIISSLFNLQSGHIKDKQAFEIFKSSQNRVRSMALIHERLYQSKDLTRVDFAEYSQSLTTHLFSSSGINANVIKFDINIKDVFLDINTAIPCGLIINELVTNSLKHAFPNNNKGEIKITMHPLDKNEIELIVSDNGVGIPTEVDFRDTESLGLHLVTILAEDQLHGDIKLKRARGTSFSVKFGRKR